MSDKTSPPQAPNAEFWRRFRSALAVLISVAILGGGAIFAYVKLSDTIYGWRTANDYIGTGGADVIVTVQKGATITQIGSALVDAKVIKTVTAFKAAAAAEPRSSTIQAGNYKLKEEIPAAKALAMLLDPNNLQRKRITIPEGLRLTQQLQVISKGTGITEAQLTAVLATPEKLGLPAYVGKNAEGVLFPDTYEVADSPDPVVVLRTMVDRYKDVATGLKLEERAAALGLTPYQVLIIASIIEEEVSRPEDRPKVARVILNRLKIGMALQLDSTVNYVLNKSGQIKISSDETKAASPYNTYINKGLPPGPISAPGKLALEAALNPAAGNWLYWTTINLDTRETLFEDDFATHNANNQKFLAWCAANPGKCK